MGRFGLGFRSVAGVKGLAYLGNGLAVNPQDETQIPLGHPFNPVEAAAIIYNAH